MITIGYVIDRIVPEYEQAKKNACIQKPMAYTLYKMWDYINWKEKPRTTNENIEDGKTEPTNNINQDALSSRLGQLMMEKGLTGKKLSDMTGLTESLISDVRNGKARCVSYKVIVTLAKTFNVTTDWLLGLSERKYVP